MWYEMTILHQSDRLGLAADVRIAADSPWFKGHFPGKPVLPGIAQLNMVWELIRQSSDKPVRLKEISRVRFKKLILPEDRIRIEAVPKGEKDTIFAFRIFNNEELVTSGNLTISQSSIPDAPCSA